MSRSPKRPLHALLRAAALAFAAGGASAPGLHAQSTPLPLTPGAPDVVLVIADDVGWEDLAAVAAAGHAPNLVALGRRGFVMTNLRTAPVCSPSRRMVYTGEFYAEQSGVGCAAPTGLEPPSTTIMLPEALGSRYVSALIGKWHVGPHPFGPWPDTVQRWGFTHWGAGVPHGSVSTCMGIDYSTWRRIEDGVDLGVDLSYQPLVMDERFAALWSSAAGAPRFFVYAAQLAHSSNGLQHVYHRPPPALLPGGGSYPPTPDRRSRYEAMIAALDTQVGKIVAQMDLTEDVLIFVGDNGTPIEVSPDPLRSKTTTFERGVRVPAFLAGKGIPVGSSGALASIVDLYATVCDLAGARTPRGLDSRSLLPLVRGSVPALHEYVAYGIRGDPQFGHDDLAVSSLRFKYRRWRTRAVDGSTGPWVEEFYDLATDPGEHVDRISDPALAAKIAAHAAFLDAELP